MVVWYNCMMWIPEPCEVCGKMTNRTALSKGVFYFLCKEHCNEEMVKCRFNAG